MSIELEQVSYIYHPATPFARSALHALSLHIAAGETLGITGDVGAGKSTLLQMINGLLQPSSGRVLVEGREVAAMRKRELADLRRRVGLVFQHPERQIFADSLFDEIAFGPHNAGLGRQEINERVEWALQAVGLSAACQDRPNVALSAGEQRRVAIAGVLALQPAYLLLDEPTAGLDGDGAAILMETLAMIGRQPGKTIVMVSHNLRQLLALSDRIVWLREGRVWLDLRREEIIDHYVTLRQSYQLPEVLNVMHALRELDWPLAPAALTPETLGVAIADYLKGERGNDLTQMDTD